MVKVIVEARKARICPTCERTIDEGDEVALYECAQCGEVFDRGGSADGDSTRCPGCSKFAARLGDACDNGCSQELQDAYVFEHGDQENVILKDAEPFQPPNPTPETEANTSDPMRMRASGCPKCGKREGLILRAIDKGGDSCRLCGWKEPLPPRPDTSRPVDRKKKGEMRSVWY